MSNKTKKIRKFVHAADGQKKKFTENKNGHCSKEGQYWAREHGGLTTKRTPPKNDRMKFDVV